MARIKVGDRIPSGTLGYMSKNGPGSLSTDEIFKGKKVALFSVPGAFTPTCSAKHLPGFVAKSRALKAKGVDTIACVAVNDVFVMDAWGKNQSVGTKVMMLADGNGQFTKSLGLGLDLRKYGLGKRGQRFSMLVDNGVVKQLNLDARGSFKVSDADTLLKQVK